MTRRAFGREFRTESHAVKASTCAEPTIFHLPKSTKLEGRTEEGISVDSNRSICLFRGTFVGWTQPVVVWSLGDKHRRLPVNLRDKEVSSGVLSLVVYHHEPVSHYTFGAAGRCCLSSADKDSATVLGILGKEINKTSGKLNHWGWVAKEGFPHYMVLHLTLALAEVAHCFSCHRLYNYPFPTDAEWYNTSEVCISHGLDDLQLAGQISTRALSITLSTPRQVFFIERPSGECTVEKMVQLNTVLLVVAIVLIVFIAACVLYWVRCRKRTRRTPKTKIPVNDTESQLPLSDTEIQKSLNETESQQPFVETVEDHDNKKNSYISLHEEPLGNVSVRPNSRSPGPPVT